MTIFLMTTTFSRIDFSVLRLIHFFVAGDPDFFVAGDPDFFVAGDPVFGDDQDGIDAVFPLQSFSSSGTT